jgi:hypothetical protein
LAVKDRSESRGERTLRLAVLGSLLVHAVGFFLWGAATNGFAFVRPLMRPTPPPDVVVTTSNAIRIEHRAKPQPVSRPHPVQPKAAAPAPQRAALAVVPKPVAAPAEPTLRPPARALHELAKEAPAAPNPPRTIKVTAPQRPEPTNPATAPPQKVALAERSERSAKAGQSKRAQLSAAQLAHIGEDISKTLAQLHAENDPLAVHSTASPSAQRRVHVQMMGVPGDMRHAQGSCYPIKSWVEGGYDYYYETCDVQFDDGHYESQAVPWPIRYPIGHDLYHGDLGHLVTVPLPPPLPGWKLPAGEHISEELRQYAKDHGVDI